MGTVGATSPTGALTRSAPGLLADFLAKPALGGFMNGIAITILIGPTLAIDARFLPPFPDVATTSITDTMHRY